MTQPTAQHRQDISRRVCLSYGVISDLLWRDAIELREPVGNCTRCGGLMRPGPDEPYENARRMHYPARCASCGREVEGKGPRPTKQEKPSRETSKPDSRSHPARAQKGAA